MTNSISAYLKSQEDRAYIRYNRKKNNKINAITNTSNKCKQF